MSKHNNQDLNRALNATKWCWWKNCFGRYIPHEYFPTQLLRSNNENVCLCAEDSGSANKNVQNILRCCKIKSVVRNGVRVWFLAGFTGWLLNLFWIFPLMLSRGTETAWLLPHAETYISFRNGVKSPILCSACALLPVRVMLAVCMYAISIIHEFNPVTHAAVLKCHLVTMCMLA